MKLSNYIHFLKNPSLYPHLLRISFRKVKNIIFSSKLKNDDLVRASKKIATSWCEANYVATEKALSELDIKYKQNYFEENFAEEILDAKNRTNQCPFELGGPGNLTLIYQILESLKAKNVVETGVAYGWSSLAILCSLANRDSSHLWSIDMPYVGKDNSKWVGCAVPEYLKHNWTLLRMADREGVPQVIKSSDCFDVVHYDSDKSVEGRMFSYPMLWNHLKQGGIFISDDISDNEGFKRFCEIKDLKPLIVRDGNKYQGIIKKK